MTAHRLLIAGLLTLYALPTSAQAVTWEQLPLIPFQASQISDGVAMLSGPTPTQDSLLQIRSGGVFRFDEGAGEWTDICYVACRPDHVLVTEAGSILIGSPAGTVETDRSVDRGATWEIDVNGGTSTLFQSALPALRGPTGHGAIFGDTGIGAYRSQDDGAAGSWRVLGDLGGIPVTYGEVPPSAALPDGRLLAGVRNGVTTSDDGGATWTPATGAYGGLQGDSFAFVAVAGHPYGGVALAGMEDLTLGRDSSAVLYRSEDGGATWALTLRFSPSAFGVNNLTTVRLLVTPDGGLWAGLTGERGGPPDGYEGAFARSEDGGATWAPVSDGYAMHGVEQLIAARDGRLVAATGEGAWRTTGPVYAVASEGGPEALAEPLSVFPNPSGDTVTVRLGAASAEAGRVVVTDVRGRVVRTAALAPGARSVTVDVSGLAAGVYGVRAESGGTVATGQLTVAR